MSVCQLAIESAHRSSEEGGGEDEEERGKIL